MKTIEFRAFRKYPNPEMLFFTLEDLIFNRFNKQTLIDFEGVRSSIMQSSGLKDKKGKKIYEGDILRGIDYPFIDEGRENYLAVIERSEHNGGFYSYPQACSDRVRGMAAGDYVFDDGKESAKRFEVIGNIHENKNLLQNGGGS